MSLEGFVGDKIAKGIVALQRPLILVLMTIASIAFIAVGFYAIAEFGYPVVSGEIEMNENASLGIRLAFALLVCIPPFLLSWLSWHYARRALTQIREDRILYFEDPEE